MATRSIADILPVLMPRLDDNAKVQLLSSVAPVCQDWWTAVEDLYSSWPACSLDVEVKADDVAPATWQAIVSSFVRWLPRHAGVVGSICIWQGETQGSTGCLMQYTCPQLQLAIGGALQAANSAQALNAAGHHRLLQLQEYRSNCMGSSCVLQALPAAHLTALQLALPQHSRTDPAMPSNQDLKTAISRLTNLQSFSLTFTLQQTLSTACCESFAALSRLTSLELGVCLSATGTSLLLQSLQAAPLQKLQLRCTYESWQGLDLMPLTHLTELQLLLVKHEVDAAVLLPLQLKVLAVKALTFDPYTGPYSININTGEDQYGPPVLQNLRDLQELQAFSSTTCNYLPSGLFDHLAQLPSLQDLSLAYKDIWAAGMNHWEWSRMSQLHRLRIGCVFRESDPPWRVDCSEALGELEQVLGSIADLASLTSLQLHISIPRWDYSAVSENPPLGDVEAADDLGLRYIHGLPAAEEDDADDVFGDPLGPRQRAGLERRGSSMAGETDSLDGCYGYHETPLELFSHLTRLSQLQDLHMILGPLPGTLAEELLAGWPNGVEPAAKRSAQEITVLTGLTSLQLAGFGAAVDDAVALALAGRLRNLQHLDLRGCDCGSREVVQKLERLPMLRELLLDAGAGADD